MGGRPVWLASYSFRDRKGTYPAHAMDDRMTAFGKRVLLTTLGDLGDKSRWRFFRMSLTLCMHRAATAQEIAACPARFGQRPRFLAGAPAIEIIEESHPAEPSCQPCKAPRKRRFSPPGAHPRRQYWLAEDCGRCAPCLARATFEGVVR